MMSDDMTPCREVILAGDVPAWDAAMRLGSSARATVFEAAAKCLEGGCWWCARTDCASDLPGGIGNLSINPWTAPLQEVEDILIR